MTEFVKVVASCDADRRKRVVSCKGGPECLQRSARQLKESLDGTFPDSEKVELESEKVTNTLSSVFFLAILLSNASQGLAEFDNVINNIKKAGKISAEDNKNIQPSVKFQIELNEILARYFWKKLGVFLELLVHPRASKQPTIVAFIVYVAHFAHLRHHVSFAQT